MQFKISHITEYSYSDDVFLEPHYFRFKPKVTPFTSIADFSIKIEPEPTGFSEQIDIENNHILLCWFEDMHQKLSVSVNTTIDVTKYNPFNFLVHPAEYLQIPFKYKDQTKQLLEPSLKSTSLSDEIKDYVDKVLKETNHQSVDFLTELTKLIHKEFILETRETGEPHLPELTFSQKRGSCRDLAWMQIQMLRNLGIATRFVSGYFYLEAENPEFELHAWLEVYLPGAGWIGFDPSHGILANYHHIPVASSAFHENAMPVTGSVRGNAQSELKNELEILLIK